MTDAEYRDLTVKLALRLAAWAAQHGNDADRSGALNPEGGTPTDVIMDRIKVEDGPDCIAYAWEHQRDLRAATHHYTKDDKAPPEYLGDL